MTHALHFRTSSSCPKEPMRKCAWAIAYGGGEKLLSKVKMKKMTIRGLLRKDVFRGENDLLCHQSCHFMEGSLMIPDDP